MPAFARFASEGVKADYVQPIYPSISMPSWTTIVTGAYGLDSKYKEIKV